MGAVITDRQEAAVVLLGIGERSWARIHRNYPTKTKSYCGTKCGTTTNMNRIKLIITIGYIILMAVLSDECEPVSVDRKFQEFMQHRVAATQQEQLHVEPYMYL